MGESTQRRRRFTAVIMIVCFVAAVMLLNSDLWQPVAVSTPLHSTTGQVVDLLETIPIKGRASKAGYSRTQFGDGWEIFSGCDMRNIILDRDLQQPVIGDNCKLQSGTLNDPYTGKAIRFNRGADSSADIQIDHVVALSDAWQKGAQQLTKEERQKLANDPLELLAVDGPANQQKGDGDAATWLPPNKAFRCQYVARQVAVKLKYHLWMTRAEKDAIRQVLNSCPGQSLPTA